MLLRIYAPEESWNCYLCLEWLFIAVCAPSKSSLVVLYPLFPCAPGLSMVGYVVIFDVTTRTTYTKSNNIIE